jgi:hypothetical protein
MDLQPSPPTRRPQPQAAHRSPRRAEQPGWVLQLEQFEEIELPQITTSVLNPDGYEDHESAFLFTLDNGGYDVEGRFCDLYGDGHMELCELRIRLHVHDEHDGGDEVSDAVALDRKRRSS